MLTGRILAYGTTAGVAGAHVTIENGQAVDTDDTGTYRFASQTTRVNLPFHITVEADGYLTRSVNVGYQLGTRTVDIDVIREALPFSLPFYRQFARNAYELPDGPLESLWPLEDDPSIYIKTVDQTGRPIEPGVITRLSSTLREAVRDWTHGKLSVPLVETGTASRPRTEGWIIVNIERDPKSKYCGLAWIGSTQGEITFTLDRCDCGSNKLGRALVYHEVGHSMGFFHVGDRKAVMYPQIPGGCPGEHLTELEQYHSQLVYSRPRGNTDPDADTEDTVLFRDRHRPDILIQN